MSVVTEAKRYRLRDVIVKRIALVAVPASGHRFHLLAKSGGTAVAPLMTDPAWGTAYVVVAAPGHQEDGGILAAPGTSDVWDTDAIREACHQATIEGAPIVAEHFSDEPVGHVAESYVAPADFQVGDTSIVKGSWVLGVKPTDEGRRLIESGEASGVSIEGQGTREPVAKEDGEDERVVEELLTALAKAVSSKQPVAARSAARSRPATNLRVAPQAARASERKAKPGKAVADRLYRKLTALGVKPALARKLADDPAARKAATQLVAGHTRKGKPVAAHPRTVVAARRAAPKASPAPHAAPSHSKAAAPAAHSSKAAAPAASSGSSSKGGGSKASSKGTGKGGKGGGSGGGKGGGGSQNSLHPHAAAGSAIGGQFIVASSGHSDAKHGAAQKLGCKNGLSDKCVKTYQAKHGLAVDGKVGAQTTASLRGQKNAGKVKTGALSAGDRHFLAHGKASPKTSPKVSLPVPFAKGIGSKTPEPLGSGPLWNTPGLHLPAGIGHMARDMMQSKPSMSRQQAIATAVAAVKQGCAIGKFGNATLKPDTRAKACRLAAEWEKAKVQARATPSA